MARFFEWLGKTVETICNRPDHLQRLGIIGAGMVMYPTMGGLILIVWRGFGQTPSLYPQQLSVLGFALFGSMALWGLVVIALLGIVKGLRIDGPGGMGLELSTTADDPDVDPKTTRVTAVLSDRRIHSRDFDNVHSGGDDDAAGEDDKADGDNSASQDAGAGDKQPNQVSD